MKSLMLDVVRKNTKFIAAQLKVDDYIYIIYGPSVVMSINSVIYFPQQHLAQFTKTL